jgi:hypothetical protein
MRDSDMSRAVLCDIFESFINKYPLLKGGLTVFRELLDLFKREMASGVQQPIDQAVPVCYQGGAGVA